ncbi:MAG: hypothetical protein WC765_09370 [Phycisphaerae bacterium]|jgi:hypothetical protein
MNIIPAPRKLAPRKGVFHFGSETSIRVQADPGSSLAHHASLLSSDIEKATGIVRRLNRPKRPSLSSEIIILSAPGHKAQVASLDIHLAVGNFKTVPDAESDSKQDIRVHGSLTLQNRVRIPSQFDKKSVLKFPPNVSRSERGGVGGGAQTPANQFIPPIQKVKVPDYCHIPTLFQFK